MGDDPIVDVRRQFIQLFAKEEMLAFFDFSLVLGERGSVAGLCKIAKPRGTPQGDSYLSLLFLIDAPDEETQEQVTRYARGIPWKDLERHLSGVQTVLSIPHLRPGMGFFYKETDIYFSGRKDLSKPFLSGSLFPAILKVTGFTAQELVFWEDLGERKEAPAVEAAPPDAGAGSFLARVKGFLNLK